MSGECEQNNYFWCPLKGTDCGKGKLSKPCVLLYSATHAAAALDQLGIIYEIEEGTMMLKKNGKAWPLAQILGKKRM